MDRMIANRFSEAGGRYTDPVSPYCIGEGKVVLGRRYAEDAGIPLERCAFFGDSIYDAPFMELVGIPSPPTRTVCSRSAQSGTTGPLCVSAGIADKST